MNDAENTEIESGPETFDSELTADLKAMLETEASARPDLEVQLQTLIDAYPPDPTGIVRVLTEAEAAHLPDLAAQTQHLRALRSAGDKYYRSNKPLTHTLDTCLVTLIETGQDDVVRELISSSPNELGNLEFAAQLATEHNPERTQAILAKAETMVEAKRAELVAQMSEKGIPTDTCNMIIQKANDPDAAKELTAEQSRIISGASSQEMELILDPRATIPEMTQIVGVLRETEVQGGSDLVAALVKQPDYASRIGYARSYKEASAEVAQIESANRSQLRIDKSNLTKFSDPLAGLRAAEQLAGSTGEINTLKTATVLGVNVENGNFITVEPTVVDALAAANQDLIAFGLEKTDALVCISQKLADSENPMTDAKGITKILGESKPILELSPAALEDIVVSKDPEHIAEQLLRLESTIAEMPIRDRFDFVGFVTRATDSKDTADKILVMKRMLAERNTSLESFGVRALIGAVHRTDAMTTPEGREKFEHDAARMTDRYASEVEIADRFGGSIRRIVELQSTERTEYRLTDFPAVQRQLSALGVDPALADELFESWQSYRALSRFAYNHREAGSSDFPEMSTEDVQGVILDQTKTMMNQIEAVTRYVDAYGADELKAIAGRFGIRHFERYDSDQLHMQNEHWDTESYPVQNVAIAARADWNGAIVDIGAQHATIFGSRGLFSFEVGDSTEVARVAVAVGNRERACGRDPLVNGGLDNLIIDAHASPEGLLLGAKGQGLDVADYIDAAHRREKIGGAVNNYRRHLGSHFRVILKACSTAGETSFGRNIAETMSDEHDALIEGSPFMTRGSFVINPDGTVVFETATETKTTAASSYDGRGGDGVRSTIRHLG